MAKKDKAKRRAEDDRGAVTEEVSKTVDDAQHVAGGVASSLKDAVASGVGTVAETTTHAVSSVTHAVSSAIEKVRLPFPRARALLPGLPPSSLTPRPSSSCPRNDRRDDVGVVGLDEIGPPRNAAGHRGARREQRRKGRRARRRRGRPTMRTRQVRHLMRRPRRLFSVRSGDGPFPTLAARARRQRRNFFFDEKKKTRFDSRAEKTFARRRRVRRRGRTRAIDTVEAR